MKKISLLFVSLCIVNMMQAQLKHYISINTAFYVNYFNDNDHKIRSRLKYYLEDHSLSYKIEKEKLGVELYYSNNYESYGKHPKDMSKGEIGSIGNTLIGLNLHYAALQHKRININPFLGVIYSKYSATVFDEWSRRNFVGALIPYYTYENEKQFGLQTGVNINIPIYWSIYANTNLRYNAIPWANYNKQSFYWDVGLGYCLQRKKK